MYASWCLQPAETITLEKWRFFDLINTALCVFFLQLFLIYTGWSDICIDRYAQVVVYKQKEPVIT